MSKHNAEPREVPAFERRPLDSQEPITRIGGGSLGGKARGLVLAHDLLAAEFDASDETLMIGVPHLTVLATDVFDAFMERNDLDSIAFSDAPDDRIAHAFQRADLPVEVVGDLRALASTARTPLAVRSSSLLEDALFRPFAGVYETKMTPCNQPDPAQRYQRLLEAIKFVYASTYLSTAQDYIRAAGEDPRREKMAVILQQIVGTRHGDRFYPDLSGVCRSYNYYPVGRGRPEEGVVQLALGLGKSIVDGGLSWSYCPARPRSPPPFGSVGDLLKNTQTRFWAVNLGPAPEYDPIVETEYLVHSDLAAAEYDATLGFVASTYDARSDRLYPGVGRSGPRALNFAPLLEQNRFGFNQVVPRLLAACERALLAAVEIEFALTLPHPAGPDRARFGFLQVRPMVVSQTQVEVSEEELNGSDVLVASISGMGNGTDESIADVVYVRPETFDARHTPAIARALQESNVRLMGEGRPYLLIGFGRFGSSDPWLGIPVNWGQIAGARAIVEAGLPGLFVEPSQGSHFFHNLSSFEVSYLTVPVGALRGIDFEWLDRQAAVSETEFVRHVRLAAPLLLRVDGRTGRGVIRRSRENPTG